MLDKPSSNALVNISTNQNSSSTSTENVWLLDIRANHHLTFDGSNIAQPMPYFSNDDIALGNGNYLSISYIGSSNLVTKNNCVLSLENLLNTPNFMTNFLLV